jgi:hypothetical protein
VLAAVVAARGISQLVLAALGAVVMAAVTQVLQTLVAAVVVETTAEVQLVVLAAQA